MDQEQGSSWEIPQKDERRRTLQPLLQWPEHPGDSETPFVDAGVSHGRAYSSAPEA